MIHRLLLMANSVKPGGRCLAGLLDGNWIRPVSTSTGGSVPQQECSAGGDLLRPLDWVDIDLSAPTPLPHQGENWTYLAGSIRKTGRASIHAVEDQIGADDQIPWFLEFEGKSIAGALYSEAQGANSLGAVLVENLTVTPRWWNPRKWDGTFEASGHVFTLPITDDRFLDSIVKPGRVGRAWLCVSVGEVYEKTGAHYKLIAGVVPFE